MTLSADEIAESSILSSDEVDTLIMRNRRLFAAFTGIPFEQQRMFGEAVTQIVNTGDSTVEEVLRSLVYSR